MIVTWHATRIHIVQGDVTSQEVDAIVNAANSSLMGGGGVDGAIHRWGGPQIDEECRALRRDLWPDGLPTGKAAITSGGRLKALHVIHTVGPVWSGGSRGEPKELADCYVNSLALVKEKGLSSVAFPSISTGAYRYPIEAASRIALKTVKEFVERDGWPPRVIFVLFTSRDLEVYERAAREMPP